MALKDEEAVGKAHPNIIELVRVFKMEQASVDVTTAQIVAGARQPPRSGDTIEKDRRIRELRRKFDNNDLDLQSYISALSWHTNPLV